ncbi:MAG: hypothetical protein V8R46_01660 [Eubacterium ramulus]
MSLIKGIHHVALKCCGKEEFEKTKQFYGEVLGLPGGKKLEQRHHVQYRSWPDGNF